VGDEVDLSFLRKIKGPFERKKFYIPPVSSRIAIKRKGWNIIKPSPSPFPAERGRLDYSALFGFYTPSRSETPAKKPPRSKGRWHGVFARRDGGDCHGFGYYFSSFAFNQPHPPSSTVPLPLPGEGLTECVPLRFLSIREKTVKTQSFFQKPPPCTL